MFLQFYRSELADQALEKLQQLEPEVQDHVTWLQENSNKIEDDDVIDELDDLPLEDCEVLENEINKMKVSVLFVDDAW